MLARQRGDRIRISRRSSVAYCYLILFGIVGTLSTASAAVRPDYFAARVFGYALQQDFQQRPKSALVDRLDSTAMMNRVFEPFGLDITEDPRVKQMWDNTSFPQFVSDLRLLGEATVLVFSRVSLVNDARWIDCLILTNNGAFRLMSLRLNEAADGTIRIEDFSFAGAQMEASRAMRQVLILRGLRSGKRLEEEETDLCDLSAPYPMLLQDVFVGLAQKKYDYAFRRLSDTPEKLQGTRIWKELRNRLANLGSADAQKQLAQSCFDEREQDPFLRYSVLATSGDTTKTLTAFEDVVSTYHGLPFFRAVQADLLINSGRAHEAIAIARETYQANPLLHTAYLAAVRGEVIDKQFDATMDTLAAWSALTGSQQIDEWLRKSEGLSDFVTSAPYLQWKNRSASALPAIPVTEPIPSH